MLHQDYLVRMFMVLAAAIRRTILNTSGEKDPEASAELLESTLSNATEIDGSCSEDGSRNYGFDASNI